MRAPAAQGDIIVSMSKSPDGPVKMQALGYLDPTYAQSMAADGRPVSLAKSGGWIIVRQIPGSHLKDAMAPHPFLVCRDWRGLIDDLAVLDPLLVSLVAVTDPLAEVKKSELQEIFHHLVRPYKEHFIMDLSRPLESFIHPHHLRWARRALRNVEVELCAEPLAHLKEWLDLYDNLIRRHEIRGLARLTEESLRLQFQINGLSVFRARRDGNTIGMILCMVEGEHGYFHLGAYNEAGYRSKASYALVWSIFQHFAGTDLKSLNIGAGAGAFGDADDGLTAFKRGWASGTRMTYLCGAIIDAKAYARLSVPEQAGAALYFPPYRGGEFS